MKNLLNYQNPREYLNDAYLRKKSANHSFSIRSWAKTLGLGSHAPLHLMLSGKRKIPRKYLPSFVSTLNLTEFEASYLEALLHLSHARNQQEKVHYEKRVNELKTQAKCVSKNHGKFKSSKFPLFASFEEADSFHILKSPLHGLILEMLDLKHTAKCAKEFSKKMRLRTYPEEIRRAFKRLEEAGFLSLNSDGSWNKNQTSITTPKDVRSHAVQTYHQEVSFLAAEQLISQEVQMRQFNGMCFNIKMDTLPAAKQRIREFVSQFVEEFEAKKGEGEESYQLNVQFFSLTNSGDAK